MKKYKVRVNGFDMGIYEGANATEALDRYARDAGYKDWKEIEEDAIVAVFRV